MSVASTAATIRFIQHNCMKSSLAMHSVLETAVRTADIVLIQEPFYGPGGTVSHPSFECILPGGHAPSSRPRVALFVSKVAKSTLSLQVQTREDLVKDLDAQVFEVSTSSISSTLVYNIYNQKDQNGTYTIERLFAPQTVLPTRAILAGDFNAHHSWWNYRIRNPKQADHLVDLLESNLYDLVNEEDAYTHFPTNGNHPSVLDLTFASPTVFDSIQNWAIDSEASSGSDHAVLRFELQSLQHTTVPAPTSNRYNWKKADWELFGKTLLQATATKADVWNLALSHPHYHHNLDLAAELLRDSILTAITAAVPLARPSPQSKAWWTEELTVKRKAMARRERHWKLFRTEDTMGLFKLARHEFGKALHSAKTSHWDQFVAQAQGKDLYTIFAYTKPKRVQRTSVLQANGQTATVFKDKAQLFRHTLFPPPPAYTAPPPAPATNQLRWTPITDKEVEDAIFTSAPTKAPGPDGITFACLCHAYSTIPHWFNALFREVLDQGYHPQCWREATGAIVPKPNKPDYTAVKAYRIVALLNCLGKIAEKLVAQRLASLCEDFHLLHKDQMGGRRQRSAQDAILALVHDVELGWAQEQVSTALFLDVKGAFDNVSKVRLLQTMQQMGLPRQLVQWVDHFMSKREIALAFDGDREALQPVDTGIPQGSPCSPILFIIYLKPLFDELEHQGLGLQFPSYMDDVALVATSRTLAENVDLLERAAQVTFQWASDNAVAFDDSKSELLHFTRSRTEQPSLQLPNGTVVAPSKVLRWLGVWLDSKLHFGTHVATKLAAAERALSGILRLSNTEKGLTVGNMRRLYQACIIPVSDFGSEIWWKSGGKGQQHLKDKLQVLQNKATRRILGAFRTTPVALLDVESALPPVEHRLTQAQRRYALRLLRLPASHPVVRRCPEGFHPSRTGHEEPIPGPCWSESGSHTTRLLGVLHSISDIVSPYTCLEEVAATDSLPTLVPIDFGFAKGEKTEAAQAHLQLVKQLDRRRCMIAYSDGSLMDGKVGAGFIVNAPSLLPYQTSIGLGSQAEVFDAELVACLEACNRMKQLIQSCPSVTDCWVFLDNAAAIRRLTHLQPGPGQTHAIRLHRLAGCLQNHRIRLHVHWSPGHTRIPGNETADRLAKAGSLLPSSPPHDLVTYAYLRRQMREQALVAWKRDWEHRKTALRYHGTPTKKLDPMFATAPKRNSSRVVQVRSGHGYFNSYLFDKSRSQIQTPGCPCGNRRQTPEHLVLHCLRYKAARRQFLWPLIIRDHTDTPWLDVYSRKGTQALLEFLEATSLCLRPQTVTDWVPGLGDLSQSERHT